MKHTIEVNGIKLYAFHGCLPEEGKIGGNYIVDVTITTDFTEDIAKAIDDGKILDFSSIEHFFVHLF